MFNDLTTAEPRCGDFVGSLPSVPVGRGQDGVPTPPPEYGVEGRGAFVRPSVCRSYAHYTGHWKATGRIFEKFRWKINCKNLEIKGGVHDLQAPGDHVPPL